MALSAWAFSLLTRYQTSQTSRYFRTSLAVSATALSARISLALSAVRITSCTCTSPWVTLATLGPLSYDGTFANSILMRDFGDRGVGPIGTTICQAATDTESFLIAMGCKGCLRAICPGSMSKARCNDAF